MNIRRKGSTRSFKPLLLAITACFPWLTGCSLDALVTGSAPLLGGLYTFELFYIPWRFVQGNLWLEVIQLF
ncbi:MAG: hypothetical protein O7D94_10925 [Planctomycetota bacterium]|nr:hypothetical protein [Planctomycetota bacterium]